jgi:Carboxypeptidase regulatory-like domain/TonB-dependent Receptor Plug Domain
LLVVKGIMPFDRGPTAFPRCDMKRAFLLGAALIIGLAPAARAQLATGNIYGEVSDASGAVLPGATVTLTGPNVGTQTTTTGTKGEFRFLNLDPGTYRLAVSLPGFGPITRDVIVNTGTNANLTFSLKVAGVEETVTVTAETPVVDPKKMGTSTTLTKEELSKIPNSRDPWAVLRTIPGVVVDRVNIAGNESGQQSNFQGKGADIKDSIWSVDGVNVTDMAAIGSSPTYYDYDAFDEINVTTGGNDLRVQTGGIGLNFVTKRGTNDFHGSLRGYYTYHGLQGTNLPDELKTDPRLLLPDGTFADKANHIDQIADYGADLGGPIIKDKLWFWGSYGRQDIRNVNFNQTRDKTLLKDYSGKLNWQATGNDMVSFFYFNGAKEKFGRSPGLEGVEPDSFLWNQSNEYPSGPHGLYKGEWNHVFSPNFTVNAKYAYYGTGFGFTPRGGADKDGGDDQFNGMGVGSYQTYQALRPEHIANLDGSYFATALGGNHELKFGFGYRRTPVDSITAYSGSKIFAVKQTADGGVALVTRDRVASYKTSYTDLYLGDVYTKGRLTLNVGARYDHQTGGNRPSSAAANPVFPELLPALSFGGEGQGVTWNDVSPRAGISYALDENRKTIVRGSYARYAGQLSSSDASYDNPLGSPSYLAYNWVDLNGDGLAQKNEVLIDQGIQYFGFVDPANPANVTSPNRIDTNYHANHDNEFVVAIDHELIPDLAVSAAYTFRKSTGITTWTPRIGLTTADYTANPPVTQNGFTAETFSPDPALIDASNGGRILTNRPDYSRRYSGVEVSLTKRLSKKWMGRAAFSYMDWTESYDGPLAIQNPTATDYFIQGVNSGFAGPRVNDGQFAPRSAGSGKGDIFYGPKWQVTANALYQLPYGFEVAGVLFGRQGYPRPIFLRLSAGGDGSLRVIATPDLDTERYENLWNLDLRLSKNVKVAGRTGLVLTADLFNVLNTATELNRNRQANAAAFDRLDEVLSPRVLRFGLRFTF